MVVIWFTFFKSNKVKKKEDLQFIGQSQEITNFIINSYY